MTLSFFTTSGDGLVPADLARSLWSENQMHGVAVSGALARAAERCVIELGRGDDLRPARHTVDLFRPATMDPCRTTTRVVREGRRLCLVDATLEQDGQTVARASALFLKVGDPATSMVMNWGSNCIEYINTDITLTLARLPVGREIGLSAIDRVSQDGIAVGTATVFDRRGRLGTTVTSAIANAKRTVDFEVHDFNEDPRHSGA